MCNILTTNHHPTLNYFQAEKGVNDHNTGPHASTCIGDVENHRIVKAEVLLKFDRCARFK